MVKRKIFFKLDFADMQRMGIVRIALLGSESIDILLSG